MKHMQEIDRFESWQIECLSDKTNSLQGSKRVIPEMSVGVMLRRGIRYRAKRTGSRRWQYANTWHGAVEKAIVEDRR